MVKKPAGRSFLSLCSLLFAPVRLTQLYYQLSPSESSGRMQISGRYLHKNKPASTPQKLCDSAGQSTKTMLIKKKQQKYNQHGEP